MASSISSINYPGEIGLGLGIVSIIGASFYVIKSVFSMTNILKNRLLELIPYTASSEEPTIIIQQDITKKEDAKPILPSDNERTGVEFSYSFFLYVNESTIGDSEVLKNVFYKGYDSVPWPLLSPGVFILGNNNTMRIVLSSYSNPYNYVDVENIPINKWFHVVLNYKKNKLEVHINGVIKTVLVFTDSIPYMNYGNLIVFSTATKTITRQKPSSTSPNETIMFQGKMIGKISNLVYTRYGLSFSEIQELYNMGVSTKSRPTIGYEKPAYLADTWWTTK